MKQFTIRHCQSKCQYAWKLQKKMKMKMKIEIDLKTSSTEIRN